MMTCDRVVAPGRIHHIHVAGRGSTVRKIVLCAAARNLGCRHVLHLHDFDYAADFARRARWQQALVRAMFQRADRVIVLGRSDRETAVGLLGVDETRLRVVRNCVPDPGLCTKPPGRVPTILFLGQLGERKGVPELLLSLAGPEMAARQWRAVIAGDGPVEFFRAETERLGLANRVAMPGWVGEAEARRLCTDADILVLPSHKEGMAMAVLEGLAHGLSVVATPVGAHEEVITHRETGVFVPVGDPAALESALAGLIDDPLERQRLSIAARKHYLDQFSMGGYLRTLTALYAELDRGRTHHTVAVSVPEGRPT